MNKSINRIRVLAGRNLKEIVRDPLSLIFMVAMPLVMEILFYFIFHTQTAQFEMQYLAPGIVAFSQAFLSLFSGILISQDRNTAFLTRLYVSRARSYEFIFGYAFSLVPIVFVQSLLFFLVGGAIDPSLFSLAMLYGVFLSVITAAFFIGMGIMIGAVCNDKAIGGVASLLITGQSMLSGMWFPPDGLSKGMKITMKCLPFKNAGDLIRYHFAPTDGVFGGFVLPLLITLGYVAAAFVVAILLFRRKMKAN